MATRPINWKELTAEYLALLAAIDRALMAPRLPAAVRKELEVARARATDVLARVR